MLRISEHYWRSAIFFPRVILYTFSSLFLIYGGWGFGVEALYINIEE